MQNQEIIQIIENLKGRRNYEEKKASKLGFTSLYAYFEDKILKEKKAKFSLKEKRKIKREKKKINNVNISLVYSLYYILFCTITFGKFGSCTRSICCFKRNCYFFY